MTLHIPAKVLIHVWSYDFYDMTLSTGKQRRHMIKNGATGPGSSVWAETSNDCVSKGTSRQRSGKGANRKRFPLKKPRWEKTN